jgi:hypothetical protein
MKILPFHREHLKLIEAREYEREKLLPFVGEVFLNAAECSPYCFSLVADGRVIACIGCFQLWDGVLEAWQIPSVYVQDYVISYCRVIRGLLNDAANRTGGRRIQTSSPADELHDRWMKFIGFTCEGTMKEYSRFGLDYRLWSRRYPYGR